MSVQLINSDILRLYEVIVYAAKRYGMAGATVLKGVMGYGASSSISSMKFFELSEKLPMIIEIVDTADKIDEFTEILLPYLEKIQVWLPGHRGKSERNIV